MKWYQGWLHQYLVQASCADLKNSVSVWWLAVLLIAYKSENAQGWNPYALSKCSNRIRRLGSAKNISLTSLSFQVPKRLCFLVSLENKFTTKLRNRRVGCCCC
jgi:hypothetical protein